MKRRSTRFLVGLAGLVPLALVGMAALFVRPDLERDELVDYIDQASHFAGLPGGAVVHYRDAGDVEDGAVVLLHGELGSLCDWEPWVPTLVRGFRVVSVDLPGHGLTGRIPGDVYTRESMVEVVRELVTELRLERFALAGHAKGGEVAALYALTYPDQVEALILVAPEVVPRDSPSGADRSVEAESATPVTDLRELSLSPLDQLATHLSSRFLVERGLRSLVADDARVTADVVTRFERLRRHEGNRYAVALMFRQSAAIPPRALEPELARISVPVLLQLGAEDPVVPPQVGSRIGRALPDGVSKLYEQTGHLIMLEASASARDAFEFLRDRVELESIGP